MQNILLELELKLQTHIARYYNSDKTDAERKIRNEIIEEYRELIAQQKVVKSIPVENVSDEALIEKLSEEVHKSWMEEKTKQGFHAPLFCPTNRNCSKCHADLIPYSELPENIKDYDRVTVRTVLRAQAAISTTNKKCDANADAMENKSLDNKNKNQDMKTLEELANEFTEWSLPIFKEATALSSLEKCDEEIKEVANEIQHGGIHLVLEEYVDCFMCLFDSAARAGYTPLKIKEAFAIKLAKNKARKWVMNKNKTYSHVK